MTLAPFHQIVMDILDKPMTEQQIADVLRLRGYKPQVKGAVANAMIALYGKGLVTREIHEPHWRKV